METRPLLVGPADWVEAIAALPAEGPLPLRTVIVSSEREAHSLRRRLIQSGRERLLGGTRFVGPVTLAQEVLLQAGREFSAGEERLRPARLLALFAEELALEYIDLDLARRTPGWAEAIASAIGDLESAELRPDRLPTATPHWRDLALLWRRLDAAAGPSWTAARTFTEASAVLKKGPRPRTGSILVAVSGRETAALATFIGSLPDATVALAVARPLRDRHLARVETLFGTQARVALAQAPLPPGRATERDILARHFFTSPEVLADPARLRSRGPDGTVRLEAHAGIDGEVEAAAEWVIRQVLEHRTPLEEIALLFPSQDPTASLVATRLARIPFGSGSLPVHVAGGLPAAALAGGARALSVVRALRSFLPAELLADLLPALRAPMGDRNHVSHEEATSLAWSLGTVGGSASLPEEALQWTPRARARAVELEADLARLAGEPEAREAPRIRAARDAVHAVRPALDSLVEVARLVVANRPLAELAPALLGFLRDWLLVPSGALPVRSLLESALQGACDDEVGLAVRGVDAVAVVEQRLLDLRVPTTRFGEPAVYVGTLAGAIGLDFQAVRILGLSEGALPAAAREDAVLPDRMREELDPKRIPISADRALGQLHSVDLAVRSASLSIALSGAHSDLERSEREISSVLVEAGSALGRPDALREGAIPNLASLARTAFGPARRDAAVYRAGHPVTEAEWLDRAAEDGEVPPGWNGPSHVELARIRALLSQSELGPRDGVLGRIEPFPPAPGLIRERPISASALETLLTCPLRFLYLRILHWNEPAQAPATRELDPLTYGALFHRVMEAFYAAHGADFVARKQPLAHWQDEAAGIADSLFEDGLTSYPLVGRGVENKERARLAHDVAAFLEYDWGLRLDRFVAVEKPFGTDAPVKLAAGGAELYVRGYVDRIDVEGDHTLLRDLKTGSVHPRRGKESGPTPARDVQLGLYARVAKKLHRSWGVPNKLQAAYAYARSGDERAFRSDYAVLEEATRLWLDFAAHALSERAFPPTPRTEDCTFCPFSPVCGADVPARAAAAEEGEAGGAVAEFFRLKRGAQ